eukprot:153655-Prorocentrum_minimum.AAC.1
MRRVSASPAEQLVFRNASRRPSPRAAARQSPLIFCRRRSPSDPVRSLGRIRHPPGDKASGGGRPERRPFVTHWRSGR